MKQISITDEQYDFLKNLQNRLLNQDNRCTADPYFFQILVDEIQLVGDLDGDGIRLYEPNNHEIWFDITDTKNMEEHILEHIYENPNDEKLYISNRCINLIKEFETHYYKD